MVRRRLSPAVDKGFPNYDLVLVVEQVRVAVLRASSDVDDAQNDEYVSTWKELAFSGDDGIEYYIRYF